MQSDQLLGGRYRLGERLGRGGMSVVHRAYDEVLERDVAVKLLVGSDASARRRILAEAKSAARLSHPHVTNIYDYGESATFDGQAPFVVMELLTGRTLAQRLAAGPLPPRPALRICAEVADALAAAHAQGLVHRDMKPSNVVLTPTGAKVVDFGIAAVAGASEIDFDGRLLGTPAYAAPERLDGGEVAPASDVYALGVLLYQVLTGVLPWQVDTPTQTLRAHAFLEPAPLPAIDGVPAQVNRLCGSCLAKDPADRPSAAEVAGVLFAAARDSAGSPSLRPAGAGLSAGAAPTAGSGLSAGTVPSGGIVPPTGAGPSAGSGPARAAGRRRRALLVVGGAVLLAVAAAGSLGDPSLRTPGAIGAEPPSTGAVASATGARRVPVDAPGRTGGAGSEGAAGSAGIATLPPPTVGGAPVTATGPPVTTPDPVATPGTPSPTPADQGEVAVTALGGVVAVRCAGRVAEVVSVTTAAGYQVEDYEPGPVREVRVRLVSPENTSEVRASCANGRPVPRVKESGR